MARDTELSFRLEELGDLFAARYDDPFSPDYDPVPVIDKLVIAVGALPPIRRRHCRFAFNLARGDGQPEPDARLIAALRRYCAERVKELEAERASLRSIGWRELAIGLGILAICLILSSAVLDASVPNLIQRLFGEGLIIAGWVVLWRPVETLVFESGHSKREAELYKTIGEMDMTVAVGEGPKGLSR